jgi:hypothetical protein
MPDEVDWSTPQRVLKAYMANVPPRRLSALKAQLLLDRKGAQSRAQIARTLKLSRPALVDLARNFSRLGVAVDGQPPVHVGGRTAGRPSIHLVPLGDYIVTAGVFETADMLSVSVRQFGGHRVADLRAVAEYAGPKFAGVDRRKANAAQAVRLVAAHLPGVALSRLAVCSSDSPNPLSPALLPTGTTPDPQSSLDVDGLTVDLIPYAQLIRRLTPAITTRERFVVLSNSEGNYRATLLTNTAAGALDEIGVDEIGVDEDFSYTIGNLLVPLTDDFGNTSTGRWCAMTDLAAWHRSTGVPLSPRRTAVSRLIEALVQNNGSGASKIDALVHAFASGLHTTIELYEPDELVIAASPWVELWPYVGARVIQLVTAAGQGRHVNIHVESAVDTAHSRSSLLAEIASELEIVERWGAG